MIADSVLKDMTGTTSVETEGRLGAIREFGRALYVGRRKVATGGAAVLALGLGYHVIFGAHGLTVFEQKRQETQALHEQLDRLQQESEQLKGHVERLEHDPSAIEHQAREELHYTRPGEVIYALPGGAEVGQASRSQSVASQR